MFRLPDFHPFRLVRVLDVAASYSCDRHQHSGLRSAPRSPEAAKGFACNRVTGATGYPRDPAAYEGPAPGSVSGLRRVSKLDGFDGINFEPAGAVFPDCVFRGPVLPSLDACRRQVKNATHHVEGGAGDVEVGPESDWVPLGGATYTRVSGRRFGFHLVRVRVTRCQGQGCRVR